MAKKVYDIAVKTGTYTDKDGNEKGRYQQVGAVIKGDNGSYMVLERWFNPAGIANPDNRSSVILSLFEPKDNQQQQSAPKSAPAPSADYDDDVPF